MFPLPCEPASTGGHQLGQLVKSVLLGVYRVLPAVLGHPVLHDGCRVDDTDPPYIVSEEEASEIASDLLQLCQQLVHIVLLLEVGDVFIISAAGPADVPREWGDDYQGADTCAL